MAAIAALLNSLLMMAVGWLVAWRYSLDNFQVFAIWWSIYSTITAFAFDYIRTGVTRYAGGRHPDSEKSVYLLQIGSMVLVLVASVVLLAVLKGTDRLFGFLVAICACTWAACEVAIAQRKAVIDNRGAVFLLVARTLILLAGLGVIFLRHSPVWWVFVAVSVANLCAIFCAPGALRISVPPLLAAVRGFRREDLGRMWRTFLELCPLGLAAALLNLLLLAMRSLAVWRFDSKVVASIALTSDLGLRGIAVFFAALMIFPMQHIFRAHDGDGDPREETISVGHLLTVLAVGGLAMTYFTIFVLKGVIFPKAIRAEIGPYLMVSVLSGIVLAMKMYMADLHLLSRKKVLIIVSSNLVQLSVGIGAAFVASMYLGGVGISLGGLIGVAAGFAFSAFNARRFMNYDRRFLLLQTAVIVLYLVAGTVVSHLNLGEAGVAAQVAAFAVCVMGCLTITMTRQVVRNNILRALVGRRSA